MSGRKCTSRKSETTDRNEAPTSVGEVLYLREDELQNNDVTNNRYLREADLAELNRRQASRIAVLIQQNNRLSTFRGQVAYILSHPASFVCILAIIILGVYVHWNMVSEINILREQNAALIEQQNRHASQIEKLEADSKVQLREYQITLDAVKSENLLLRDQIAFANQHNEFLQSQMQQVSDEFKEKDEKAMTVRLQESQFHKEGVNYLVQCLLDKDSASETFTGIKLLWGALQVGYTTKSGLNNCLTMYEARYHQQISYQIDQ